MRAVNSITHRAKVFSSGGPIAIGLGESFRLLARNILIEHGWQTHRKETLLVLKGKNIQRITIPAQ
jgi:hypothetical protein